MFINRCKTTNNQFYKKYFKFLFHISTNIIIIVFLLKKKLYLYINNKNNRKRI